MARERTAYVQPTMMACAFALAGRMGDAFDWLERAFREHDCLLPTFNYYAPAAPLRTDPRLRPLMRRLGLVPAPDLP